MIVPAEAVRVVIATRPVDFRRGHDSLAALARHQLGLDPHSGVIMVFRSKRGDRIREGIMRLSRAQFEALFDGLEWQRVHGPRRVRRPTATE